MTIRFGSFSPRLASWVVGSACVLPALSACTQTPPDDATPPPASVPVVAKATAVAPAGSYTNPVLDADRPDPGVLRVGNTFYMLHTMGGVPAWPLYTSSDLTHWQFSKHLLTPENRPAWIKDALWAPEIHRIGGKFVLTFTAGSNVNKKLCIGMAFADKVDGPYKVQDAPVIADTVAVIDSHLFQDDDGKNYLVWKRDGPKGGVSGSIRLRQLNNEGTAFAPNSKEVVLLESDTGNGQPWEKGLVEAPWMLKRDGTYYLMYSGAFIGTDFSYSIGTAKSKTLTGMFERKPSNPILHSNDRYGGPGHGAFVDDSTGQLWHLYHARDRQSPNDPWVTPPGKGRVQLLDLVVWKDGWPSFAGDSPSTTPQPAPKLGDFPPYVYMMSAANAANLVAGAEDDMGVKSVEFFDSQNGKESSLGKAKLANSQWTLPLKSKLKNGVHVYAKATDSGGHVSASHYIEMGVKN
ncbi:xylan 1,3-beta-xylosidase [Abditibacteriota bacterium]|nr:xylan 1,3-beta-xylosidase [Abditibacteriota bacterium]